MHVKLQELIDYTKEKFQLHDFHLKRHHIFKEKDVMNHITYIFNMEWFPSNSAEDDNDLNPSGTVSIDLDFHTRALKNIIFVDGVNELETNLPAADDTEGAIEWIEQETGLAFGRQFKLSENNTEKLYFHAAADNIPVFPSGHIQLHFNEKGTLSLFSIYGMFPEEDKINWEPFDLTSDTTERIAEKQCTLFEIPVVDKENWQYVYGISHSFITNKKQEVVSYEEVEADSSYTPMDEVLAWEHTSIREFSTQNIDIGTESTLEAALANEQTGSAKPITEEEQEKVTTIVRDFLQSIFPDESAKWKINSARHEADYLFIELKLAAGDTRILQQKITVVLDKDTFEPINYVDNTALLDTFQAFTPAPEPKLTKEEAFAILSTYVQVTPVYVYNKQQDYYTLCGHIQCDYAVDAVTGEIIHYDDLN